MKTEPDLLQQAAQKIAEMYDVADKMLNEPFDLNGCRQMAEFFGETKTDQELFEEHRLRCQTACSEQRNKTRETFYTFANLFDEQQLRDACMQAGIRTLN